MSLTSLLFVGLYFYGIVKALTGRAIFGLYSYILSIYLYAPGSWWGQGLPDLRWSLLSALVTFLSIFLFSKRSLSTYTGFSWAGDGIVKYYVLFVVWIWIQSAWAVSPSTHYEFSILVTKFLLLIFLIKKSVLSDKDLVSVFIAHLVGCMYFGYIGLTQHSGGRFESVPTPGMNDGNLLSIHMLPILIIGSYLLLGDFGKKKFILGIPIVLTLNAIFLTESRGALVGVVGSMFLSLFFVPLHLRKLFRRYILITVFAVVSLMGQSLVNRISSISEPDDFGEVDASAASRLVIIRAQLAMFKEKVVLGYGHKGTMYLSSNYIPEKYLTVAGGEARRASHNIVMSLLVDHGIVGFFLYFGATAIVFIRLIKIRRRVISDRSNLSLIYIGASVALFSILITSQFSNSMRLEISIWFLGLLSLIYERIKSLESPKKEM